jgi:hypothetical protein
MLFLLFIALTAIGAVSMTNQKQRIIVTTDGEVDDEFAFIRLLSYANEFEIEGLVYTNSTYHPRGEGTTWMQKYIAEYAKVRNNLLLHDRSYPAADSLSKKIKTGILSGVTNFNAIGEGKDSDGSNLIVSVLLDNDPRPVWLLAWGGLSDIGQALYRIQKSHAAQLNGVKSKARIYAIANQEGENNKPYIEDWIRQQFPELLFVQSIEQFWEFGYIGDGWGRLGPTKNHYTFSVEWMIANIESNHGPLGASYQHWGGYVAFISEGDAPSYFHLFPFGLRSIEHPTWGGWGGRFKYISGNWWKDAPDDGILRKPFYRWIEDIQLDWAARMDWCVMSYEKANHPPSARIYGYLNRGAKPGEVVSIDASPSSDPDGNAIAFNWWHYKDAGRNPHNSLITISNANSSKCNFTIPANTSGKEIHIILEVSDNGTPKLKNYRRVVFTISNDGQSGRGEPDSLDQPTQVFKKGYTPDAGNRVHVSASTNAGLLFKGLESSQSVTIYDMRGKITAAGVTARNGVFQKSSGSISVPGMYVYAIRDNNGRETRGTFKLSQPSKTQ